MHPRAPAPLDPLDPLSAGERRRAVWRRRLVGGVVITLALGLLVLRCEVLNERQDDRLQSGLRLVVRGLEGSPEAFADAERTLASAATFTDPYPLFALEASRRLRERRWDDAAPPVRVVFLALSERRWDDAHAAVRALPIDLPGRAELARLVTDLDAARLAAPNASGR